MVVTRDIFSSEIKSDSQKRCDPGKRTGISREQWGVIKAAVSDATKNFTDIFFPAEPHSLSCEAGSCFQSKSALECALKTVEPPNESWRCSR